MKKLILLLIIGLFATSKSHAVSALRQTVISQPTHEARRLVFLGYTSSEKRAVWIDKIDQVLSLNTWSSEQVSYLNQMKSSIVEEIFNEGSSQQQAFDVSYSVTEAAGVSLFGTMAYAKIFFSLHDYDDVSIPTMGGGDSGGQVDCGCCTSCTFTCDWVTGTSSCETSGCAGSLRGCGGLWNQKCNGECVLTATPSAG